MVTGTPQKPAAPAPLKATFTGFHWRNLASVHIPANGWGERMAMQGQDGKWRAARNDWAMWSGDYQWHELEIEITNP